MNYQTAAAKISIILLVLILDTIKIVRGQSEDSVCYDISPYCSEEDCWIRPGYAVEYCKKTCGDCQAISDSLCYDSEYFPCVGMDLSGCDKYLKDYCPVLCGICHPVDGESSSEESDPLYQTKSTFLGLFQPSQWMGAIFNPSSTTDKFTETTTAMLSTMSIQAKIHYSTTSVSLETTTSTTTFVPTSTTIPITTTTPTTISNSTLTSTSTLTTILSTSASTMPSTSTIPTPMPTISSSMTASSTTTVPECKTETTSPTSIMATSTITAPAGLEMPTTAYVPEMRSAVRYTPDEYMSYLRQLSVAGRSSTKQTTRAPTMTPSLSPQRPRSKAANHIFRPPGGGSANKVDAIARRPPAPKSPMTMTTFARAPQILFHRPPRVRMASAAEVARTRQSSAEMAAVSKTFFNRRGRRPTTGRPSSPPPPMARHTASIADIVTLLGCRDRDEKTCSQINEFSCHARPGYYLKLCPVKCKNCNGLLCYDSNKIDCSKVVESGGCQVPNAAEYCPQSCNECPKPSYLNDSGSRCKDEFPTCKNLAASGICHHIYNVETLRLYCAKSCGFCKESPFYFMDAS